MLCAVTRCCETSFVANCPIFLLVCTAANGDAFPYLLVNIGSGVSLLKVCHKDRVWGLLELVVFSAR